MSLALAGTLIEQRANTAHQMREMLDAAEARGGQDAALTGEEEATFQRMSAELDGLGVQIKTLEDAEARMASAEKAMARIGGTKSTARPETTADGFRSWLTGESKRAFELKPEEGKRVTFNELRSLVKGTSTAGGNLVPTDFYSQLVQHLIEVSAILQAGPTVLNTASGEAIQIPKTTSSGTAAIVSEGGTIPASDPAFGQVTLNAYKYGLLLQISHELANDAAFDLTGFIALETGRALGNAFGAHLVTGTGSSQPSGAVTGASLGVTGATTGVSGLFTSDELISLFYSVIAPYRSSPSCGWLMRDATVAAVSQAEGLDRSGQYLWQNSIQLGVPDNLLGKPVYTDPNVAAVAVSAKSVLFGDWSRYFVRQLEGVRFERSDDFAFNTDLITYRAIIRGDGALIDTTGGIKYFAGAAT